MFKTMYLLRICFSIIFLVYSAGAMGQDSASWKSTSHRNVQSQLDSLKSQLNDLKYQLNLIVKLLQDRTQEFSYVKWHENSNLTFPYPKETTVYIDSFVERDIHDSILCPSELRLKRLGMTPREYFTQNTPQGEEMVCYLDEKGVVIAGSGMVDGKSLRPRMYKEVSSESKRPQNQTIHYSKSSASDIATEIRRQEANAKLVEAGTELFLNAIFGTKKK